MLSWYWHSEWSCSDLLQQCDAFGGTLLYVEDLQALAEHALLLPQSLQSTVMI